MTVTKAPMRIGDLLVQRGLVTPEQVEAALERQRHDGGTLGQQLVLSGAISRLQLYRALAEQWDAQLVDLIKDPPQRELIGRQPYHDVLNQGWVAWRGSSHGRLEVATTVPPTGAVLDDVRRHFPKAEVSFVTTTDWDLWRAVEASHRRELLYESQDKLSVDDPGASARSGLTVWQNLGPLTVLVLVLVGVILAPTTALASILVGANLVFLLSIAFKTVSGILAPLRAYRRQRNQLLEMQERRRRGLAPLWLRGRPDGSLPIFTILMPVFHEANIVEKLVANIGALDYPKSKLDVLLLLEESDEETIAAAKAMNPPAYVRLVVVPPGQPQTKPRACNYGLAFARGDFVVIYDAEDQPHPDQLRKAVEAFDRDEIERTQLGSRQQPLACVQASLAYFNADYNVLTRMFAVEYAHWFEAMLPGMDNSRIPIPLGGTSNHFHTGRLRELGAWDPWNVTEDADLGLRASVRGYRASVIDSSTGEEATAETRAWIRQRTRWIKGYIVTSAVNTRHPVRFARRVGLRGVIGMVGLIMATPLAFLVYPVSLGFTALTYVGVQFVGLYLPHIVELIGFTTFLFGNACMIISAGIAATWRYNWRIGIFAIFCNVYWLLHSYAAWRALFQVLKDPHTWEKTPHGLTKQYESTVHV
ncbi:glycosyltransferase [Nocardioides cheoyonin]|uniref:glycosyltransferase n=1 Tax=Nocardioides cheoyonin TaxID=3156615 RepID=UPI0032B59A34